MNTKLFELKPCEECNGTGDAHHQGHDYDCPDCLGTGHEEPAKRIMNLELMLNQHKETLKSSDAHNNELAQQLEIAREQRDRLAEALEHSMKHMRHSLNCPARITEGLHPCNCQMELAYDNATEALQSLITNADVDLPDTSAQDSASKSNSPAVSG